jgi:hypothetical protein
MPKSDQKHVKILVSPLEIAGYYKNLCLGFEQIGADVDFVTYSNHPFDYGGVSSRPLLIKLANKFNRPQGKENRCFILRVLYAVPREILTTAWALIAICRYDVFIFSFGRTLLRGNYDLRVLRKLRKVVIMNLAHGSESRPPFIDGYSQSKDGIPIAALQNVINTRVNRELFFRAQKYSDIVIGAPFCSQYATSKVVNIFSLGLPIYFDPDLSQTTEDAFIINNNKPHKTRILHSPSHPAAKGSPVIIKAVESLRKKGYDIEFVLIHGRPFADVLAEIKRCDFVVDQLYSDTPMAGFSTEAAWHGKPSVVGGYGLESLRQFVNEGMWPPSRICHPDEIQQAIEELIVDTDLRKCLGLAAQNFVQQKWNAVEVAMRFMCLIKADIPDEWWLDPNDVVYLEGACQPIERTIHVIQEMVGSYGVSSLQLSHRPDLEDAFLKLAGIIPANK